MKYILPWFQPIKTMRWFYRKDPQLGVIISYNKLSRDDEPELWLLNHYRLDVGLPAISYHYKCEKDVRAAANYILQRLEYRFLTVKQARAISLL